jgi:hypothetical protein
MKSSAMGVGNKQNAVPGRSEGVGIAPLQVAVDVFCGNASFHYFRLSIKQKYALF